MKIEHSQEKLEKTLWHLQEKFVKTLLLQLKIVWENMMMGGLVFVYEENEIVKTLLFHLAIVWEIVMVGVVLMYEDIVAVVVQNIHKQIEEHFFWCIWTAQVH